MTPSTTVVARQLQHLCIRIGDEAADEQGFVPIRELLRRFHIELISRPLLVEGMLATITDAPVSSAASRWAVLIDSETYPINDDTLRAESWGNALPARVRNTIAHELTHSLAFRPSQFGLEFAHSRKQGSKEFVKAVERDTEKLSPLLLFPEKALDSFLARNSAGLSLNSLLELRSKLAISGYVLVNRLRMLLETDRRGFLARQPLRNIAVGMVEWAPSGPLLRRWPLFMNFDRNVVPDLLWRIRKQDRVASSDLGIPDECCESQAVTFSCEARVAGTLTPEHMTVRLEIEPQRGSAAAMFFLQSVAGAKELQL